MTAQEQRQFEQPPHFTNRQRRTYFAVPDVLQKVLDRLQTKTNKILFLVQLAYFKACQQFFDPNQYLEHDIAYAAQLMGFDSISNVNIYRLTRTSLNHQKRILDFLGYRVLDNDIRQWITLEIKCLDARQVSPKKIFLTVLKLLQERCIAFPSYHALSKLISDAFLTQEKFLLGMVKTHISEQNKTDLELLLKKEERSKQIPIQDFKSINQSVRPRAIQSSVTLFERIKGSFKAVEGIVEPLNLHEESIRYYGTWVRKSKLSQLL